MSETNTPTENPDNVAEVVLLPQTEATPNDQITAVKLGDIYDPCLLGATMRGNYAYSLKRMIQHEMRVRSVDEDTARDVIGKDIIELMRMYGMDSPEFIDDELMEARIEIIMPS